MGSNADGWLVEVVLKGLNHKQTKEVPTAALQQFAGCSTLARLQI